MRLGIFTLVLAYMLSQFYRAFLAVLAPVLETDIGATPEDLSLASGLWFLTFALMQIPIGSALDKIGPRLTASVLLGIGGVGGAVIFAMATHPAHIKIAMAMIGIGCAPVLMASYYIFARIYSTAIFATLAGGVVGIGSLGNIASSLPMTWASQTYGWRETLMALALMTLIVSIAIFVFVKDPEKTKAETQLKGSVFDLLKIKGLWLIFPMMFVNYAAAAGIRGLWIGPYLTDVFKADATMVGQATFLMGICMAMGSFAYGPIERLFRTRKWVIVAGNFFSTSIIFALAFAPLQQAWFAILLMAAVGFFASSFAVLVAHAKTFFPPHLTGRGVTLVNLFGIGGAGVMQSLSGKVHEASAVGLTDPSKAFQSIFVFFGVSITIGVTIYLFSHDRPV